MKHAIAVGYCVGQNGPSKPIPKVLELPEDEKARDQYLKDLFVSHVCEVDSDDLHVCEGREDDYGDLVVSYGDDLFLYVTYIKE